MSVNRDKAYTQAIHSGHLLTQAELFSSCNQWGYFPDIDKMAMRFRKLVKENENIAHFLQYTTP